MILRNDAKVSSDFELDKKKEYLDNFVFVVVRLFLLAKKRLTEGSFFVDGDMVDNSTQTPRDDDSGKPEEEVTIEEDDATGAAPDNPTSVRKNVSSFIIVAFSQMISLKAISLVLELGVLRNLTNLGVLLCW